MKLSALFFFALILSITGCSPADQTTGKKIKVAATTSMVADLAKTVGGDRVVVQGLMGAGVDPHLYKATASDVSKLQQADVIFYSGLLLEGKLQELFDKLKGQKKIYAVTDAIPRERLLKPEQFAGHFDPHVWFEVPLWEMCVDVVVKGLSETDLAGKAEYEKRGEELRAKMKELHQWTEQKISELPVEKRILITSHDAFNYFGRAHGFQVVGLQGISTADEAGLADMAKMVDFIKAKKIKAVFVESSVPHNTIGRISKDAGVKIGGELFSDAMGTPGQIENGYDLGTYEGMIKHNANTVVNSLK